LAPGSITNVLNFYLNAKITAPAHGLSTGDRVAIGGAHGVTNVNSLTGQHYTVTVVDADRFTIPHYAFGIYTAGTGWWGEWIAK
jgi:hypothetical protein